MRLLLLLCLLGTAPLLSVRAQVRPLGLPFRLNVTRRLDAPGWSFGVGPAAR